MYNDYYCNIMSNDVIMNVNRIYLMISFSNYIDSNNN